MAKNIKLDTKKKAADGRIYINGGFFHRYLCSRTASIVIMVLQVLSLILTTVFALVLGVFGSVVSLVDVYPEVGSYVQAAIVLWLISSVAYVLGEFVLFLGFSRIACCVHGAAAVMLIVMYYLFSLASKASNIDSIGPAMIYMPCLLITLISIAIAMVVNIPLWLDKKAEQDREIAPSILADEKED